MFCNSELSVLFSFAIILKRQRAGCFTLILFSLLLVKMFCELLIVEELKLQVIKQIQSNFTCNLDLCLLGHIGELKYYSCLHTIGNHFAKY